MLQRDFESNWRKPTDMTLIATDASALYPDFIESAGAASPTVGPARDCTCSKSGSTRFRLRPCRFGQQQVTDLDPDVRRPV